LTRPVVDRGGRSRIAAAVIVVAAVCGSGTTVLAKAVATSHKTTTRRPARSAATGIRGGIGPTGPRGPVGRRGPAGPAGPSADDIDQQAVTINWQNGQSAGRDTATFDAPGIGTGEIVCSPDTQWLRFFPADANADTAMTWLESEPGSRVGVNTALRTQYTGPDFYAGFNDYLGQQTGSGSVQGIISSRLDRTALGGPGPPPTTFRVTWNWNFAGGSPSCSVAGEFVSPGSAS
jgi:hypothetical protein